MIYSKCKKKPKKLLTPPQHSMDIATQTDNVGLRGDVYTDAVPVPSLDKGGGGLLSAVQ